MKNKPTYVGTTVYVTVVGRSDNPIRKYENIHSMMIDHNTLTLYGTYGVVIFAPGRWLEYRTEGIDYTYANR